MIDLIESSCQGLLQDHPAALDPVPTFARNLVPTPSPISSSTSPLYQTPSPSVDEGGPPHVVLPVLAVRPPTPGPLRPRAEVVEELSDEPSPSLSPLIPFVKPPSPSTFVQIKNPSAPLEEQRVRLPQQEGIFVLLPPEADRGNMRDEYIASVGCRINEPTLKERIAACQNLIAFSPITEYGFCFIIKLIEDKRNPLWSTFPLFFERHQHHLYYLQIQQNCNCTDL